MADGTIWGVGGRRGKLEVPLGPPPSITDIWVSSSDNVLTSPQTLWSALQPVSAAPLSSNITENPNIDALFYHPITVSHLNPTLVIGPTLPSISRGGRLRQSSLSLVLTTILDKIGLHWRNNRNQEPVPHSNRTASTGNHAGTTGPQTLERNIQDVGVSILIQMPVSPVRSAKYNDEMSLLGPLVIGITHGRAPQVEVLEEAPVRIHS